MQLVHLQGDQGRRELQRSGDVVIETLREIPGEGGVAPASAPRVGG